MRIDILDSLASVHPDDWNALTDDDNPFVRHEFLFALEQYHCLEEFGWYPQHVAIFDNDHLVAAMPMYIKDNSYGELVFDWAWADAYHRSGLPYYPKLVTAIPYTPASGPRLLVADDDKYPTYAPILLDSAIKLATQENMSSVHWLFTNVRDTALLKQQGMAMRLGCQFHWHNQNYKNFDDYLQHFASQKRKKIKRERKRVSDEQIQLEIRHGQDMTEELWETFHSFYRSTFDRKSGMATLTKSFFQSIGETMPENVVVVFARHAGHYVASALNIRGRSTLFGRHWGCSEHYHSLHFEACYYQGLEYCIQNALRSFEPGAQGEHKVSRGFLPTATWSGHWIRHSEFATAIQRFTEQEQQGMQHYIKCLAEHSPFRKN